MLIYIIIATIVVALVSLVGVLILYRGESTKTNLRPIISLAAGALLAVSFLNLLPEAIEKSEGLIEPHLLMMVVLGSILVFFLFERVLHWHHCSDSFHSEDGECDHKHGMVGLNLIGDGIHNIIDGFLIAGAFMLDFRIGVVTTFAVILHEIPQELADFGVLLYGGLSKIKALIANLLVGLTAVLGAIAFYYYGSSVEKAIPIIAAVAAGNFIYLAMADLIPELHHEKDRKKIIQNAVWLFFGVGLIYGVQLIFPHN